MHTFFTDPLNPDTDGGTVNDGDEVADGTDPLESEDDGQAPPNEPPVAEDQALAVSEASTTTFDLVASDPDFDILTVTITDGPDHGQLTCEGTTTCTYSPDLGFTGPDAFTYEVDDGNGGTDTATVSIEVLPCPNLDPRSTTAASRRVRRGSCAARTMRAPSWDRRRPYSADRARSGPDDERRHRGRHGPDAAGRRRSGQRDRGPGGVHVSILRIDLDIPAGANCLAFDLAFQSEEYPEFVNAGFNDGFIAELGTSDWSVENSVITAPNNFAFDAEGNVVSVDSAFFDPQRVIEDPGTQYDGSTPKLRVQTPITPGPNAMFLSIFDAGDHILDSGAFIDGLVAGTSDDCEAGANEPPVADDEELDIPEDDPGTSIDVLDGDTDADGDPLSITSISEPEHGTAVLEDGGNGDPADDTIVYTPDPDYFGPDAFTYTVSDGRGGSDTASVTITVTEINDPPVAGNDSATTDEGVQVVIDLSTNDVPGPANESGQTLTDSVVTSPSSGQVDCTPQGSCTYTPDTGTFGPDGFTYEVCDDGTTNGSPDPRCTQATVSVSVEEAVDTFTLTVSKDGTGSGTVTSPSLEIDCGTTCQAEFADGAQVTLTATPTPARASPAGAATATRSRGPPAPCP